MKIVFVPVWGYMYRELSARKPRMVDICRHNDLLKMGNVVVYMEFDFATGQDGKPILKPGFTGRYTARKIKQTLSGYPGVEKDRIVLMLKRHHSNWFKIRKGVRLAMAEHAERGGVIPPP